MMMLLHVEPWRAYDLRKEPETDFEDYAAMLSQYTCKALSDQRDIIHASEGILRELWRSNNQDSWPCHELSHGIPFRDTCNALLWFLKDSRRFSRRQPSCYGQMFSGWRWSGWVGLVSIFSDVRNSYVIPFTTFTGEMNILISHTYLTTSQYRRTIQSQKFARFPLPLHVLS